MNRLETAKKLVYDAETSGLDWRKNHIVGHVLTFSPSPKDSYYLPVRHAGGGNIGSAKGPQTEHGWNGKLHKIEKDLVKRMDRPDLEVTGHHLNFDLRFMWQLGYKFKSRFTDTMINAPLLNEFQPKFGLGFLCNEAGVASKKSDQINQHIASLFPDHASADTLRGSRAPMGHYWRLAGDDVIGVEYAEGDGTSTWQLKDWQEKKISEQEMGLVHDIESRLISVLARMSCVGIKVDEERLGVIIDLVSTNVEELEQYFNDHISDFNPRSPEHVEKWCTLHGQMDWPLTPKKQAPSFTKDWLESHDPGKKIVNLREWLHLRDSFLLPLRDEHLFKGRVHTTFNQLKNDDFGTVTGRLSSSYPNMQQIHKRNVDLGKLLRSVFIPDEGKIWANADYKQIEPVLLAYYSRSKILLEGYRRVPPIDAHSAVTKVTNAQWRDLPDDEVFGILDKTSEFKAARETGKRVNQTLITGGGKKTLVDKYKVQDVDKIWKDYFDAMPEIRILQKRAAKTFQRRGYIMSLLGRRAHLRRPDLAYTAVNRLLQCGNADIIKLKMVQIDEYLESVGRPIDMLNNIHDDLAFQFSEENRKHYNNCLEIMTDFGPDQPIELDVPLGVDPGEGKNWAIATYGED